MKDARIKEDRYTRDNPLRSNNSKILNSDISDCFDRLNTKQGTSKTIIAQCYGRNNIFRGSSKTKHDGIFNNKILSDTLPTSNASLDLINQSSVSNQEKLNGFIVRRAHHTKGQQLPFRNKGLNLNSMVNSKGSLV